MSQNNLNMHRNYSSGYVSSAPSSRNVSSMHKAHSVNSFNLPTGSSSNNNNNNPSNRLSRPNNGSNGSNNHVSYNSNVLSMPNYQYLEDAINNGKYRTNIEKQANNLGNLMHSYNTFKVIHSKNTDEQYSTKHQNSHSNSSTTHHKSSHSSSNRKSASPNEHENGSSNQIPLIIAQGKIN